MGLRYRRPKTLQMVWLHIDRLDRKSGRVWAIQWRDERGEHYRTAHAVGQFTEGHTRFFGWPGRQPVCVIEFPLATVKFSRHGKKTIAAITLSLAAADRDRFAPTSSGIAEKRRARV